jgi:hypothetical protein
MIFRWVSVWSYHSPVYAVLRVGGGDHRAIVMIWDWGTYIAIILVGDWGHYVAILITPDWGPYIYIYIYMSMTIVVVNPLSLLNLPLWLEECRLNNVQQKQKSAPFLVGHKNTSKYGRLSHHFGSFEAFCKYPFSYNHTVSIYDTTHFCRYVHFLRLLRAH